MDAVERDRAGDDDDDVVVGTKRKRRGEQQLDGGGLAIDIGGAVLKIQPAKIWQKFATAHPQQTSSLTNAFARYALSGLCQRLLWNSTAMPAETPEFWCNQCGEAFALSVKKDSDNVQFTTFLRHIRNKHSAYVLPCDIVKAKNPFATASAAAAKRAEDAEEEIPGAPAVAASGHPLFDDDVALKKYLTTLVACSYLADGEPANTISHIGERYKLGQLACTIKPDYAGGMPSWYQVDKEMVARANAHIALLTADIAGMHVHEFITARYSLIVDKWDDDYGNDVLGVVVRWLDRCVAGHNVVRCIG
jgi:hypothetical protein